MDATDRDILRLLQEDGRLPNAVLAERVHLSPSPCLRRLRRLEQDGLIAGYRAVLDRRKVGLGLTVFIEIKVSKPSEAAGGDLQSAVREIEEVVACHVVSGDADFLLEVVVRDLEHYETLLIDRLLRLPHVTDGRSNFVIRTVKADGPLPLAHADRS